jgi:thioredoxin-like negative regulator of GroEL
VCARVCRCPSHVRCDTTAIKADTFYELTVGGVCEPVAGGCEHIEDIFEEAATLLQHEGVRNVFAKVNFHDIPPHVRARFGVHHYPLLAQFKGTRNIGTYEGAQDPKQIANFVRTHVRSLDHEL